MLLTETRTASDHLNKILLPNSLILIWTTRDESHLIHFCDTFSPNKSDISTISTKYNLRYAGASIQCCEAHKLILVKFHPATVMRITFPFMCLFVTLYIMSGRE